VIYDWRFLNQPSVLLGVAILTMHRAYYKQVVSQMKDPLIDAYDVPNCQNIAKSMTYKSTFNESNQVVANFLQTWFPAKCARRTNV
jgi:hypothetical protein